jgi:hypothetical protein
MVQIILAPPPVASCDRPTFFVRKDPLRANAQAEGLAQNLIFRRPANRFRFREPLFVTNVERQGPKSRIRSLRVERNNILKRLFHFLALLPRFHRKTLMTQDTAGATPPAVTVSPVGSAPIGRRTQDNQYGSPIYGASDFLSQGDTDLTLPLALAGFPACSLPAICSLAALSMPPPARRSALPPCRTKFAKCLV